MPVTERRSRDAAGQRRDRVPPAPCRGLAAMTGSVAVSVVIPARDEADCIGPLLDEIAAALGDIDHEIIVIDDGSTDATPRILAARSAESGRMRVLRNARPFGQSAAIRRGVREARADLIVTLDGDGQNPPDQIPKLLAPFGRDAGRLLGLVQGERTVRRDAWAKRWGSVLANAVRRMLLRDGVRDSACGLRAFRREAYLELPWFDHIHRFLPAMMLREGWGVEVVAVSHRERQGGRSKYGNLSRALVGVPDLLGAAWLIRRSGPPRHEDLAAAPDVEERSNSRTAGGEA